MENGRLRDKYHFSEKIVRLDPDFIAPNYTKGEAFYYICHDPEEAFAAYEQNIRLFPDNANAYNDKGIALEYFGRLKEALLAFEQAIRLDPNGAPAYFHKGRILSAL